MSKHTPGPWKIDTYGEPIIINGGDTAVCELHSYTEGSVLNTKTESERLANAHLIEAAPDMLLELTNARNVIQLAFDNDMWGDVSDDEHDSREEVLSVIGQIDEVIKKAEGRTP